MMLLAKLACKRQNKMPKMVPQKSMKKLDNFIAEFANFDLEKDSDKVILLSFFVTEVEKKEEISTKKLKDIYEIAGLPAPQNFGGEISNLLRSKRLIKTKSG